jgi:hypothetical protein
MRIVYRAYLLRTLGATLLCQVAVTPSVGQIHGDPVQAIETLTPVFKRNQLESLLGREVRTRVEQDAGRVIDLLADRHGRVQAAVIEFGGFLGIGTRKIAVDWRAFNFDTREQQSFVILELSREQLRRAPEYTAREPVVVRTVN